MSYWIWDNRKCHYEQGAQKQRILGWGGLLRTEDGRMEGVASGHRPSWFLTEEAQTEAQVLLLSAAIIAACTAAWPPQRLRRCNTQKHTQTVTY